MFDFAHEKSADWEYFKLVNRVLNEGAQKGDRTGTGTLSVFGHQMRFDLSDMTIPMLTTKKMFTRGIIREIFWYLQGATNIQYLLDHDVHIWDEWADETGELGPVYGKQWRNWETNTIRHTGDDGYFVEHDDGSVTIYDAAVHRQSVDQIANVINTLRTNPNDRRMIVNAWNVGEIEDMALPPCHMMFQFYSVEMTKQERQQWAKVNMSDFESAYPQRQSDMEYFDSIGVPSRKLSCQMYQRSCDVGLGVPFNIVQYSILTHMIAQVTGHTASEFVWTGGDVHIYNNHIAALTEQLSRDPYPSPTLRLNPEVKEIDDFVYEDFEIVGYYSHPTIKMEVSV